MDAPEPEILVRKLLAAQSQLTVSLVVCAVCLLVGFVWVALPVGPDTPWFVVPVPYVVLQLGAYAWVAYASGRAARTIGDSELLWVLGGLLAPLLAVAMPFSYFPATLLWSPVSAGLFLRNELEWRMDALGSLALK